MRRLINWLKRLLRRAPRYRAVSYYDSQADVPAKLRPRTLAVVGSPSAPKWAMFTCPCERGHKIVLNLSTKRSPHWEIDPRSVSIYPSVDSLELDRCHFWIRDGDVHWVRG